MYNNNLTYLNCTMKKLNWLLCVRGHINRYRYFVSDYGDNHFEKTYTYYYTTCTQTYITK